MTADDQQHPAERPTPAIILGIPGRWKDRTKLVEDIATKSAGYVFAGGVMLHVPTQQGFQVDVGPHDPRIIEAFKLIGQKTLTRQDYKNIERHTFMLYLTAPGGSIAAARQVMAAGPGCSTPGAMRSRWKQRAWCIAPNSGTSSPPIRTMRRCSARS
jgi:hypothetical protein